MTEEQARTICAELGATLNIKRRRRALYVYVQRWIPSESLPAHWKKSPNGQAFDRYICSLKKLPELDEATLRRKIAALPDNPNKRPTEGQYLDRTHPDMALWHAQTETPAPRPIIPIDGTWRKKEGKTMHCPVCQKPIKDQEHSKCKRIAALWEDMTEQEQERFLSLIDYFVDTLEEQHTKINSALK